MAITLTKDSAPPEAPVRGEVMEDDGEGPLYIANPKTVQEGGAITVIGDLRLTFAPQGAKYDDSVRVIPRETAEGSMDLQKALATGSLIQINKRDMTNMFRSQQQLRDSAYAEAMEGVVFEGDITGEELEVDPEVLAYGEESQAIARQGGLAVPSDRSDAASRRPLRTGRRLTPDPGAKIIAPHDGIDSSQMVGDVVQ